VGQPRWPEPVILFCGLIAAGEAVLHRALEPLRARFGGILLRSAILPFDFTDYYESEMGGGLVRQFVAFEEEIDPGCLAAIKLETNRLEQQLAEEAGNVSQRRTVNLDPGYVTPDKVVLATTKNYAHRIYLSNGIYAEVTLNFGKGTVRTFEWTYPDYRTAMAAEFFLAVRRRVLEKRRQRKAARPGQE